MIEKKEEKKVISSWVVEEKDIQIFFRKDFDAKKHETEFESLTDHSLNKELEEVCIELVSAPKSRPLRRRKCREYKKLEVSSMLPFSKTRWTQ